MSSIFESYQSSKKSPPESFNANRDLADLVADGDIHDLGQFVSMAGKERPKPSSESDTTLKDEVQH